MSEFSRSSQSNGSAFLQIADQIRYRFLAVNLVVLLCLSACGTGPSLQTVDQVSTPSIATSVPVKFDAQPVAQRDPEPVPLNQKPEQVEIPQQIYRPDDKRPRHDARRLAETGIRSYDSKRLKLYTDIDETEARALPALIDQLYDALEAYFGPMPPDRAGTDFQMTGYLMRDMALYRELGLVPDEVIIDHGRHKGNEFWMRDQAFDYYRRHLMIHEATHCFMTYLPDTQAPVWYLEGMAEHFGTHRINADNQATFRVIPNSPIEFAGFGRIEAIRDDVAKSRARSIETVIDFQPGEFKTLSHYGWSWALCAFLDGSPRYHDRFQQLGRYIQGGQFHRKFNQLYQVDLRDMETDWTLLTYHLQDGYDFAHAAINFAPGSLLPSEQKEIMVDVQADLGWQSSRIRLEQGHAYRVTATGRFSLCEKPKPWISEPQGITYRYFDGHPVGMLLGCLRTEEGPAGGREESMLRTIALGNALEFQAPVSGTLYLRLNDAWNSLSDNRGHADVTIREIPELASKSQ